MTWSGWRGRSGGGGRSPLRPEPGEEPWLIKFDGVAADAAGTATGCLTTPREPFVRPPDRGRRQDRHQSGWLGVSPQGVSRILPIGKTMHGMRRFSRRIFPIGKKTATILPIGKIPMTVRHETCSAPERAITGCKVGFTECKLGLSARRIVDTALLDTGPPRRRLRRGHFKET